MLPDNPLFKITEKMLQEAGINRKQAMSLGARYKDEFFMLAAKHFPEAHQKMNIKNKERLVKVHEKRRKKAEKDKKDGNPRFFPCIMCKKIKTIYTKGNTCQECEEKEIEDKKERLRRQAVVDRRIHASSPYYDSVHSLCFF